MIFVLWRRLISADPVTFTPLSIVEMIFGNGNARNPITKIEIIFFYCLITIGFFFGTDLTSGLTSITFTYKNEKALESFEDLRNNNITIILSTNRMDSVAKHIRRYIIDSKVKYEIFPIKSLKVDKITIPDYFSELVRRTLFSKNLSFSNYFIEIIGVRFPKYILINNEQVAQVSSLKETEYIKVWFMNFFSPFVDRFSDVYWRVVETG